ncbi:calcium/calmodulin-dependent 3',5'-cyclic nucleotide phosphodiesterase 1A isoform X3 [Rhinatrema bivittatum]|uniref:calcium/calmodulin-dependent 3',5'-cyclic nucleotide phosphodiesterase 1A isoform X3 n=1 Tax=Rhinatrema bivittatum TaxID=194408 RepID=UPI00112B7DEB|nr:calcium/calmodulin-dependent 3',5'-cyclic nucleotide phosphodiesterase 1A isoform X3 [Rhinatrema bivittatum]
MGDCITVKRMYLQRPIFRLRCLVKQLERGDINVADLKKNIEYAASVLEAVYIDETRRLLDTEDELSDIQSDSVPLEVRDWLASTFTRKMGMMRRRPEEKPKFRSIVHAVQAGIFVERMYRKSSNMVGLTYPSAVIASLKIPVSCLISFVESLEVGYSKYKNPYHNLVHAADVTQTVHYIMLHTGIMHWLTELEILAMVFAAAVHDYEHTGTTNNFHIQTRSDVAILYNDRSVLENHHVSAAYRIMQEEETNIFTNLSKDDWRDLRTLVIEMVLSTDMSGHFQQIKTMRNTLQQPEGIDKAKAMSLILHAADISHPAKTWDLHHRWTMALMEEFFRQGDKEVELGLPFSPLCDRKATMVAQSQIGFIDFIVEPTFSLLTDSIEKIVTPLIEEAAKSENTAFGKSSQGSMEESTVVDSQRRSNVRSSALDGGSSTEYSLASVDLKSFKSNLVDVIQQNKERWKELAIQEESKRKFDWTKDKDVHRPEELKQNLSSEGLTTNDSDENLFDEIFDTESLPPIKIKRNLLVSAISVVLKAPQNTPNGSFADISANNDTEDIYINSSLWEPEASDHNLGDQNMEMAEAWNEEQMDNESQQEKIKRRQYRDAEREGNLPRTSSESCKEYNSLWDCTSSPGTSQAVEFAQPFTHYSSFYVFSPQIDSNPSLFLSCQNNVQAIEPCSDNFPSLTTSVSHQSVLSRPRATTVTRGGALLMTFASLVGLSLYRLLY